MIGIEFHSGEGSLRIGCPGSGIRAGEYMGALVAGELLNRYRIITAYTLNNPNVIRLEPPLVIEREQMDYMLDSLERTLSENKGALSMMVSSVKSSLVGKVKKK